MSSQGEVDSAEGSLISTEAGEDTQAPTTVQELTATILQSQNLLDTYRVKEEFLDSDSDDESDVVIEAVAQEEEVVADDKTKKYGFTVKGELTLDDLPPVEKLQIEVPLDHLRHVGNVYSFVDRLVVVESLDAHPVLNLDSVLFLEDGRAIGTIFDVIGPVKKPYYVLRFNNPQEIADEHLDKDTKVFYADGRDEITFFVFERQLQELMLMKGSDASWEHDVEAPPNEVEYSDDEAERAAKQERRAKRAANGRLIERNGENSPNGEDTNSTQEDGNARVNNGNNRNRRQGWQEADRYPAPMNSNGRPPRQHLNYRAAPPPAVRPEQTLYYGRELPPRAGNGHFAPMLCPPPPYAVPPPNYNPWTMERPQLVTMYATPSGYVPCGSGGFPVAYAPQPFMGPQFAGPPIMAPQPGQPVFMGVPPESVVRPASFLPQTAYPPRPR